MVKETIISAKFSIKFDGKKEPTDPEIKKLINDLMNLGITFEYNSLYLSYVGKNNIGVGGTRIVLEKVSPVSP